MARRRSFRIRTTAWLVVGALALTVLVVLAVQSPGYATTRIELNNASVWVTYPGQRNVGRVNRQINELDAVAGVEAAKFDVLQEADTVVVVGADEHLLQTLDVAKVRLGDRVTLPDGALTALGGGILAVAEPATGKIFAGSAATFTTAKFSTPLLTVDKNAAIAVSSAGTLFAVAAGARSLWEVHFDAAGHAVGWAKDAAGQLVPPAPAQLAGGPLGAAPAGPALTAGPPPLSVTTVGDVPVVLDRSTGLLRVGQHEPLPIDNAARAVLQQPGPADADALVATPSGLLAVSLATGAVRTLATGVDGAPAAPVRLGGCAHGAWSGSQRTYALQCGGAPATLTPLPDASGSTAGSASGSTTAGLVFRVNRNVIVLNDQQTGNVWGLDNDLPLISNWADFPAAGDTSSTPAQSGIGPDGTRAAITRADCTTDVPAMPKPATGTAYPIRSGRTAILRVLDGLGAGCSPLTVASVTTAAADTADVTVVADRQAIQITVPAGRTSFPDVNYVISDGVSQETATLSVRVVDPQATPEQPQKLFDSVAVAEVGRSVTYNVLPDFRSPTGDDLYLSVASTADTDEVSWKADGTITFQDRGATGPARKQVDFTVADASGVNRQGTLFIDVRAAGSADLQAQAVFAHAFVNQPATVTPLRSVISAAADPVQLAQVSLRAESANVSFAARPDGSVLVTATAAGSYVFLYKASVGAASAVGVMRVDVDPPPATPLPPLPMADVVYLSEGATVTFQPAANDEDPMPGGMAVQQASADTDLLNLQVRDMDAVRVSARRLLPASGGSFHYEISNAYGSATGEVRVVRVPASTLAPPLANGAKLIVRAGDVVTLPISSVATDPNGDQLTVLPFAAGTVPTGQGLLFSSPSSIRYLAPGTAPSEPVQFPYTVVNTAGRKATALVSITVTPPLTATAANAAPAVPQVAIARVVTGGTVDVRLPLDGIDPDGDWVTLTGAIQPSKPLGAAEPSGPQNLSYTAFDKAGIDEFSYTAQDTSGLTVTGLVRVIVVQQPSSVLPPSAPDLTATLRPGRTVDIDVLSEIQDGSSGEQTTFATDQPFIAPPGWALTTKGNSLEVTAPAEPTVGTIQYFVQRSGQLNSGILTIAVSDTVTIKPPTAPDIFVTTQMMTPDQQSATVQIPNTITNPGGRVEDLQLDMDPVAAGGATISGPRTLQVPVTDRRQILAYRLTNTTDQLSATALIVVPARETPNPVVPGTTATPPGPRQNVTPLRVVAGASVNGRIDDFAVGAPGRTLTVAAPTQSTLISSQGRSVTLDAKTFQLQTGLNDAGPANVFVPVTDGVGTPINISVPVIITPHTIPAPTLKSSVLDVAVNGSATLDLGPLTTADPSQQGRLVWGGPFTGAGFSATVDKSVLTVTADATTNGRSVSIPISVTNGVDPAATAKVTVRAIGSTLPLASVVDRTVTGRLDTTVAIDVLANAFNPFAPQPLQLVAASRVSGTGDVAVAGTQVSVTPRDVRAPVVVRFTVGDATSDPQRQVTGTLTVVALDRPGAPGTPTVLQTQSHTVQLQWSDSDDRGSPVQHYTVYGGPTPVSCSSPCTLTGLNNDTTYTFTVTATNDMGESAPSAPSGPATPGAPPSTPGRPSVTSTLAGQVDVSWTTPDADGSQVVSYDLQINPAPPTGAAQVTGLTGLSYSWPGLVNGTQYTFQVLAHTRTASSPWSPESLPATPADVPGTPTGVTAVYDPDTNVIAVQWLPAADNGSAITGYVVRDGLTTVASVGGSAVSASIPDITVGATYDLTVTAQNARGSGPASAAVEVQANAAPGAVGAFTATAGDGTASVSWAAPTSGSPVDHYQLTSTGPVASHTAAAGQTTDTFLGLTNGTTYTFTISACAVSNGNTRCGPESSATASPAGPLNTIEITPAVSGSQVTFSWNLDAALNGRPITSSSVTIDGHPAGDASANTISTDPGYYATTTIAITYSDGIGAPVTVTQSATTGDDPGRNLTLDVGPAATDASCTLDTCSGVQISGARWAPNREYTVTFVMDCRGPCEPGSGNATGSITVTTNADGQFSVSSTAVLFGDPRAQVTASIGDVSSDPVTWPRR